MPCTMGPASCFCFENPGLPNTEVLLNTNDSCKSVLQNSVSLQILPNPGPPTALDDCQISRQGKKLKIIELWDKVQTLCQSRLGFRCSLPQEQNAPEPDFSSLHQSLDLKTSPVIEKQHIMSSHKDFKLKA